MEMILTDVQIICIILCAALSFVAYKLKYPFLAAVPAIGFFILGFEIYTASQDLLVLGLFYMTAVVQFVVCFGRSD